MRHCAAGGGIEKLAGMKKNYDYSTILMVSEADGCANNNIPALPSDIASNLQSLIGTDAD